MIGLGGYPPSKKTIPRPRNKKHKIEIEKDKKLENLGRKSPVWMNITTYKATLINGKEEVIASGETKEWEHEAIESLIANYPDLFTTSN